MSGKSILTLLILTEDTGKDSRYVIQHLVKMMLEMIFPDYQPARVNFEPPEKKPHELALQPDTWRSKSKENHRKRIELFRTIAGTLMESAGFVLFHFDGDKKWSQRSSSQNCQDFEDILIDGVRKQIDMANDERKTPSLREKSAPNRKKPPLEVEEIDRGMSRLLPIVPFYSIEAWLYQNTQEAIRICKANCEAKYQGAHIEMFEGFERDRGKLDEIKKPKDNVCLHAEHNIDLAKAFSLVLAESVYDLEKSFFQAVNQLTNCTDLFELLKKTSTPSP